jgi:hypothetical protein
MAPSARIAGPWNASPRWGGKSTRIGAYKCYACRKPFTVKIGTIFEASHVPMRHWLQAIFLMSSSKEGISSNQLHRTLGCTLKTAWFISHRIREAMRVTGAGPMGGEGEMIEADEAFIGRLEGQPNARAGFGHKNTVLKGERKDFRFLEGSEHACLAPAAADDRISMAQRASLPRPAQYLPSIVQAAELTLWRKRWVRQV